MYIKTMEVYEMITIKDLTVSYQDTLALEPLSLTIKEPTITGIIGPNGAGKSTLLKGMLGIIDHQGQTLLDQKPLQNSLQRVAYVEQKINIDYHFFICSRMYIFNLNKIIFHLLFSFLPKYFLNI